jgi:hypothetical protein
VALEAEMSNPNVETFRGVAPRCRLCNKPLKPNYRSEKDGPCQATGRRKVWVDDEWSGATEPPAEGESNSFRGSDHRIYEWSPRKKRWFYWKPVYKVRSRKFLGTFGARGDGFFCNEECGWLWALNVLRKGSA